MKCEYTTGIQWSHSAIPDVNLSDQDASFNLKSGSTDGWLGSTIVMASCYVVVSFHSFSI